MPGPGRKPATDATLRMPPLWRLRPSIQASERSVSARTLRSIIASCSARSSAAAGPSRPKPALLTTMSGSTPRRAAPRRCADRVARAADRRRRRAAGAGRGRRSRRRGRRAGLAARDQHELVAILGEHARERRPDAGRCAGDQRDGTHRLAHGPSVPRPFATRWRSAIRSRDDTPSRSAARQIRLSSNSVTRPSA